MFLLCYFEVPKGVVPRFLLYFGATVKLTMCFVLSSLRRILVAELYCKHSERKQQHTSIADRSGGTCTYVRQSTVAHAVREQAC